MIKIEVARPVCKKLKILFYGPSGSGKTIAALNFPRVLIVDSESGSDLYAGRPGIPPFHRVRCKTISELNEVLEAVRKDDGKTWDTLVIDPITVFYDVEKNIGSANNTKDLGFREWAKINNRMNGLYTTLTSLNVHVLVLAREAVEYAGEGNNLRKVGVKPDADKKLIYMMDYVLRFNPDHSADVEKSRGITLGEGNHLKSVKWSDFEPVANLYVSGDKQDYEDDEKAAERELDSLQDKETAATFIGHWRGQGISDKDVLAALGVSRLSEWLQGRSAADKAVNLYIAKQIADRPAAGTGAAFGAAV